MFALRKRTHNTRSPYSAAGPNVCPKDWKAGKGSGSRGRKKRIKHNKFRFTIYLYAYYSGLQYSSVHPSIE